jgi:aminoglycoside phosphotransferase
MLLLQSQIQSIFDQHNLGAVTKVDEHLLGFNNKIIFVNDKYVLKIVTDDKNEDKVRKEGLLLEIFRNILPVAEIIVSDFSKTIIPYSYLLLTRIEGINLYQVWAQLNNNERKTIVREIIESLRIINNTDFSFFVNSGLFRKYDSWADFQNQEFANSIAILKERNILDAQTLCLAVKFWESNIHLLHVSNDVLAFWDVHFDNFLFQNNRLVGMLDLEDVDIMSIDYPLQVVRRMSTTPKEYASEEQEELVVDEDYAEIYGWFGTYYNEAFSFENIETRVDMYYLAYDLKILCDWPLAEDRKERVREFLNSFVNR